MRAGKDWKRYLRTQWKGWFFSSEHETIGVMGKNMTRTRMGSKNARQATAPECAPGLVQITPPSTAHQVCRPPFESPVSTKAPPSATVKHATSPECTRTHGNCRHVIMPSAWCVHRTGMAHVSYEPNTAVQSAGCALGSVAKMWTSLVRHPFSGSSAVKMSFECVRLNRMQLGLPTRAKHRSNGRTSSPACKWTSLVHSARRNSGYSRNV